MGYHAVAYTQYAKYSRTHYFSYSIYNGTYTSTYSGDYTVPLGYLNRDNDQIFANWRFPVDVSTIIEDTSAVHWATMTIPQGQGATPRDSVAKIEPLGYNYGSSTVITYPVLQKSIKLTTRDVKKLINVVAEISKQFTFTATDVTGSSLLDQATIKATTFQDIANILKNTNEKIPTAQLGSSINGQVIQNNAPETGLSLESTAPYTDRKINVEDMNALLKNAAMLAQYNNYSNYVNKHVNPTYFNFCNDIDDKTNIYNYNAYSKHSKSWLGWSRNYYYGYGQYAQWYGNSYTNTASFRNPGDSKSDSTYLNYHNARRDSDWHEDHGYGGMYSRTVTTK